MTSVAPAPVRRRKRYAAQCQADPECREKATRFCLRCMYVCDEHKHGDCCKAVLP